MYRIFKINELGEQTVKHLFSIKSQIDFMPAYQRFGNIWSLRKKQLLIDTIINKFDIPKFYLNYFIESENDLNINNSLYAIIDGKQRLQAIFDFLENKFGLSDQFIFFEDEDIRLGGLRYSELLSQFPQIAPRIENYVLDVIFITTDEEDRLEELFLRLNGGIALTNAEKRNAISSYLNTRIRAIVAEHEFFTNRIRFKNTRYQHNDLLSKLIYIESKNRLANLGNKELEDFLRLNTVENDYNQNLINSTINTLDIVSQVFHNNDILLRSKGLIPVYYQFIKDKVAFADPVRMRNFFDQFEQIKKINRATENPNAILQEFDRLNQQGVHREKSLNDRYAILATYFEEYLANGDISIQETVGNLEIDDSDNYDEY